MQPGVCLRVIKIICVPLLLDGWHVFLAIFPEMYGSESLRFSKKSSSNYREQFELSTLILSLSQLSRFASPFRCFRCFPVAWRPGMPKCAFARVENSTLLQKAWRRTVDTLRSSQFCARDSGWGKIGRDDRSKLGFSTLLNQRGGAKTTPPD